MARAAVVQMVSSSIVQENLLTLEACFLEACEQGSELLVLPENFACMGAAETDKLRVAETDGDGPIQNCIRQLAQHYGVWVIAGTVPIATKTRRVKARTYVYDNLGATVAHYDKIHLFDVRVSEHEAHQESLTIEPGEAVVVVDTPIGRVGLSVCYDVRFPALYRAMALQGAECFVVPAAFTKTTGHAHWEVLLRARAIEHLCYVLAANQGGVHANGRCTYGHSMVIDPWGSVLAQQQADGVGVVSSDIDLVRLHQLRRQFPCHTHHVF